MALVTTSTQTEAMMGKMRLLFLAGFTGASAIALALALTCCGSDTRENSGSLGIPGYTVEHDGITCVHPAVSPKCKDGWCEIPSGCFIMGSPETEPSRGAYNEDLTAVTFTRGFLIQHTEMTQAQWLDLVDKNPSGLLTKEYGENCLEPDCPVATVSWQSATAFANRLSERDGFQKCYEHVNCTGDLGTLEFECEDVRLTTATTHECTGYRLPTAAEWEYAARAGTRTAFYSGDFTEDVGCDTPAPVTDSIAWSCNNAANTSRSVAQKKPNGWGLYDMLGNVAEHTSWLEAEPDAPGPLVDPQGTLGQHDDHFDFWISKGGTANFPQRRLRAADEFGIPWKSADVLMGFRLVRTLPASVMK